MTKIITGVIVATPFVLFAFDDFEQFQDLPLLPLALSISYATSIAFLAIGISRKHHWMALWAIAFFLLSPLANTGYWLINICRAKSTSESLRVS